MPGGNRPFSLKDVIGQLNDDSGQGMEPTSTTLINLLGPAADTVGVIDAATCATAPAGFKWNSTVSWGGGAWT